MVLLVSPNLPYAASFAKEGSEITNLLLQRSNMTLKQLLFRQDCRRKRNGIFAREMASWKLHITGGTISWMVGFWYFKSAPYFFIRFINSSRVWACRKKPVKSDVVAIEFCFSTPRICIHMCCASITTITP